ncbi:hypothetical protein V6N13_142708 [Hibiscus sabdariffa]|uniref:Uncharacterized protein n=1 Tax=Hibiscus sabdariffa TaxID=183260 RepID=A0ABR2FEZ3_9ROSI
MSRDNSGEFPNPGLPQEVAPPDRPPDSNTNPRQWVSPGLDGSMAEPAKEHMDLEMDNGMEDTIGAVPTLVQVGAMVKPSFRDMVIGTRRRRTSVASRVMANRSGNAVQPVGNRFDALVGLENSENPHFKRDGKQIENMFLVTDVATSVSGGAFLSRQQQQDVLTPAVMENPNTQHQ